MSDTTTEELTPALFDHSLRLYEAMLEKSHKELPQGQELEPVEEINVYEGHLTRLFAELNLPNPYYTKILDALKGQNCIEQLRRGGGVAQSRWILLAPPTEEGFKILIERKRQPKGKTAILEQRVNDLMKLTSSLQTQVEALDKGYQELYDDLQTMKRVA